MDIYLESQENCLLSPPPLVPLYFAQAAIISQLDYCSCLLDCFYAPEPVLILSACFWICSSVHLQVQHPEWFPLNINFSIPLLCSKAPQLNLSPYYKWNLYPHFLFDKSSYYSPTCSFISSHTSLFAIQKHASIFSLQDIYKVLFKPWGLPW